MKTQERGPRANANDSDCRTKASIKRVHNAEGCFYVKSQRQSWTHD